VGRASATISTETASAQPPSTTDATTRLHGIWLALLWLAWSILTLLCLLNFAVSIPSYLGAIHTLCQPGTCLAGQPTLDTAEALQRVGITVNVYATFSIALVLLDGLVYCGAAALIVWRRPRDWMALLVSSLLITQGLYENNYLQGPFDTHNSPWHLAGLAMGYISPAQVLFFCALFPNGKSVPRWLVWALAILCAIDLYPTFFPTAPLGNPIEVMFVLSGFPLVALSMIYRYRRISTPFERQQTKWVVLGVMLTFTAFMGWFLPQILLYGTLAPQGSVYDLVGHPLFTFAALFIPICLTIAVLRYRLWDIDVIINKALVYGSLTLLLTAFYAGLILGLEGLISAVGIKTPNQPLALVVSTLAVAALFQPARRRIQNVIDRRFYRRKYDAEKTLASFSAALRNEVDLNHLREHLLAVVDETMQSAHSSLWLRHSPTDGQPTTRP
jgi:hypothetical protein